MSLLLLPHLLHHASLYLNGVHFIIPCTPTEPYRTTFYGEISLIIHCIASHDTFQDKAVEHLDCRGETADIQLAKLTSSWLQTNQNYFRGCQQHPNAHSKCTPTISGAGSNTPNPSITRVKRHRDLALPCW